MVHIDAKKAYILLELTRRVVGVKFVCSPEEYEAYQGIDLDKPMHYCTAVKSAMSGNSIKIKKSTSRCPASTRALGLTKAESRFYSGTEGVALGLYKDADTAAAVAQSLPIHTADTYGVIVKPLEEFEMDPDVVLLACNFRTMMRILQGYSYTFGVCNSMGLCGNQAVCVECTAFPYQKQHINVSALCSGTRHKAGWKDDEGMVGIPYAQFHGTIQGLLQTVNAVESDDRKRHIYEKLTQMGCMTIDVKYGETYFSKKKQQG